ncbi:MAG: metal ABC transporter permease [Trueperaceae bacterium]
MIQAVLTNIPFSIMATGALVGIAATLVGTFLVLRRSSMLADAISHSIVFGIAIVWLLTGLASGPVQIFGAALTGVLTVVLIEMLTATRRVKNDAAIGLVFPALFSAGVLLLNVYARDVHIDAHTVLLGEIGFVWLDTVSLGGIEVPRALVSMASLTLVNLAFVSILYKELKLATFDEGLARSLGFYPGVLFYALLTLTSSTAVAAFDAVGAILFVAFVIVPPSAAYLLTDRLWRMILYGCAISLISSVGGYYLAVMWNVSIGGMMALATGAFLLLALTFGPRYGLIAQELRRRGESSRNDRRALVVHLHNHETAPERDEESTPEALREHLRWNAVRAQRVLRGALARELVTLDADNIRLTPGGRALAREVLEPWRRPVAAAATTTRRR